MPSGENFMPANFPFFVVRPGNGAHDLVLCRSYCIHGGRPDLPTVGHAWLRSWSAGSCSGSAGPGFQPGCGLSYCLRSSGRCRSSAARRCPRSRRFPSGDVHPSRSASCPRRSAIDGSAGLSLDLAGQFSVASSITTMRFGTAADIERAVAAGDLGRAAAAARSLEEKERMCSWENQIDLAPVFLSGGALAGPVRSVVQLIGNLRRPDSSLRGNRRDRAPPAGTDRRCRRCDRLPNPGEKPACIPHEMRRGRRLLRRSLLQRHDIVLGRSSSMRAAFRLIDVRCFMQSFAFRQTAAQKLGIARRQFAVDLADRYRSSRGSSRSNAGSAWPCRRSACALRDSSRPRTSGRAQHWLQSVLSSI